MGKSKMAVAKWPHPVLASSTWGTENCEEIERQKLCRKHIYTQLRDWEKPVGTLGEAEN